MKSGTFVLISAIVATSATPVWADYIQTFGIGDRSRALAGAVVSDSRPSDTFYTNPAGAASIASPVLGVGAAAILTTQLSQPVTSTLPGQEIAIGAGLYGFHPVGPLVVGFGVANPFAIAADYDNFSGQQRESATNVQLISSDFSPTIAYKVTDKVSVGASLNAQVIENIGLEALANFGGLFGLDGEPGDRLVLSTRKSFHAPLPPNEFRTDFDTFGYTLGVQVRPLEDLSLGVAFRSTQTATFETRASVFSNGALLSSVPASVDLGLPGHLQVGASYDVTDEVTLLGDVQWTRWSNAEGFGTASVISTPNLVPAGGGGLPAGLQGFVLDYQANDTVSVRLGAEYAPASMPGWSFRGGYWYDPSPFPDSTVDAVTFSSDRHVLSFGTGYDARNEDGSGLEFNVAGQIVFYEGRNQSNLRTFNPAGLNVATGLISQTGSGQALQIGGQIYTLSLGLTYHF